MLVLNDYRYKNYISNDYINYFVELACLTELLNKKLIDQKLFEKLNVQFINLHIGNK